MARLGRPGGLSAAGKKELWERWRAGESISDIARALQKPPGSIHGMIEATGGISPSQRRRRRCALTPSEREEISRGLATEASLRAIAARLGQSASTVCREVNRNGGRNRYRATRADEKAWHRARRPKRCLLSVNDRLRGLVAKSSKRIGHPSRSPAGSRGSILPLRRCVHLTRDDLPHPVCAGQRRSKKGVARTPKEQEVHAQVPTGLDKGTTARADQGSRFDGRASAGG
jgi:AraC-like DNA-binding protein